MFEIFNLIFHKLFDYCSIVRNLIIFMQIMDVDWYIIEVKWQQRYWTKMYVIKALCQSKFLDCAFLSILDCEAWLADVVGPKDSSIDNFNNRIFNVGMTNNIIATYLITRYLYSMWLDLLGLRYIICYLNLKIFIKLDFCSKICVHFCL